MKKQYANEFKQQIINEYKNNTNLKDILNKHQISRSTLYAWLKLHNILDKEKQITYKDYLDLQKQLEKKTRELEILEQTHCFKDSPRKQKLEAAERLFGKYPLKEICHVIDLHHATFYNYHFRRVKITEYEKRDHYLKGEIKRIFEESEHRFGAKKIWQRLALENVNTSMSKVKKLMKELGLVSKQCKKRMFSQEEGKIIAFRNYLNREFKQERPNAYWVGDITQIKIDSSNFFLCVIIDLFSRKIIAYRLSSQNNNSLTINTFKDAYENRGRPKNLSFHSDQGNNYISKKYRNLLRALQVKQSYSKKMNPFDNAVVESFFSNIKREELNSHDFESFDDLEKTVNKYMKFYNDYRPHQSLQTKTPNQVEQAYINWALSDSPT